MKRRSFRIRTVVALLSICLLAGMVMVGTGAETAAISESDFVDVRRIDPTIKVELRYANPNNITRRALYPANTSPLVRYSVAQRLAVAQKYLKARGFGLKIWDAYRPQSAQTQLWEAIRNTDFVADPKEGVGSMHTRGVAVDVTLVDLSGKEQPMPTDFDNFTPAAVLTYLGSDQATRTNLNVLQKAMAHAGFYGLRTEWWHFCAGDWANYPQVPVLRPATTVAPTPTPARMLTASRTATSTQTSGVTRATPTPARMPTALVAATRTPTPAPLRTPTPKATRTSTPAPMTSVTRAPTPTPTRRPTPTPQATRTSTSLPTVTRTPAPTGKPTPSPMRRPTPTPARPHQ